MALERARQMDRALRAGLPRRLLVALVAARRASWGRSAYRVTPDAQEAAEHPAGRALDEVTARRITGR